MRRAVFLDRDGVLNRAIVREGKPYAPMHLDELIIMTEMLPWLMQLKAAGFLLIGMTNQPEVARQNLTQLQVEQMHQKLKAFFPLDEIYTCFHDDNDACFCRKPHPGLLLQAAEDFQIDLDASLMVGDRWRDVQAAMLQGVVLSGLIMAMQKLARFAYQTGSAAIQWMQSAGSLIMLLFLGN